jgi:hypothetical protein
VVRLRAGASADTAGTAAGAVAADVASFVMKPLVCGGGWCRSAPVRRSAPLRKLLSDCSFHGWSGSASSAAAWTTALVIPLRIASTEQPRWLIAAARPLHACCTA